MISIAPHIQALIFDCDGTLADTMPLHTLAWQETVRAAGAELPENLIYDLAGASNLIITGVLNETLGLGLDPETTSLEKDERFLQHLPEIKPITPVVAIAQKYKGRLPMAVASGGMPIQVLSILNALGLGDFFDIVVTARDVAQPKPAPDMFLECARRLNVAPENCQVFEDGDFGIEAAMRAGMAVTDIRQWGSVNGNDS